MSGFGEGLRHERELRGKTIEEMSRATGIHLAYLEALERGELDALPGRAFGKLYIRAYAEVLGFDPQPLIEEYEREQLRAGPSSSEGRSRPIFQPRPLEIETRKSSPRWPVVAALGAVALIVAVVVAFRMQPADDAGHAASPPPLPSPAEVPVRAAPGAPSEAPAPSPTSAPTPPRRTESPPALTVTESAVGRRIVDRRPEGVTDRFAVGETAWFSTRVRGGKRGEKVLHVWRHEGTTVTSIPLELGGPDWRTYSGKRLGLPGAWVVEARDEQGRVLTTATFACGAGGR